MAGSNATGTLPQALSHLLEPVATVYQHALQPLWKTVPYSQNVSSHMALRPTSGHTEEDVRVGAQERSAPVCRSTAYNGSRAETAPVYQCVRDPTKCGTHRQWNIIQP